MLTTSSRQMSVSHKKLKTIHQYFPTTDDAPEQQKPPTRIQISAKQMKVKPYS